MRNKTVLYLFLLFFALIFVDFCLTEADNFNPTGLSANQTYALPHHITRDEAYRSFGNYFIADLTSNYNKCKKNNGTWLPYKTYGNEVILGLCEYPKKEYYNQNTLIFGNLDFKEFLTPEE